MTLLLRRPVRRPGPARVRVAAAVLAASVLAVGPAGPATAGGGLGGGTGAPPASDGPQSTGVKTCRLYAQPDSFGLTCGGGSSTFLTIRKILGGDPLPHCWDDALPPDLADQYAAKTQENRAKGLKGEFYLELCLEGVDPKTLEVLPGGIQYTQNVVWIEPPEGPKTLTERQRRLVATSDQSRPIPLPVVATSPSPQPRVGQDVSFYVANAHATAPLVFVGAGVGRVVMRARLVYLQVTPDPADGTVLGCTGWGLRAGPADTPGNAPGACWWSYARSSANQPGVAGAGTADPRPAYDVATTASWVVEYDRGDGVWRTLATFEREQALEQAVTEVQTLVVPG